MSPTPRDLPQRRRRLRRVMEHIGTALQAPRASHDEALSLPSLARVACCSPEHLDRIYRLHIGEPPLATIRRLRLAQAAGALLAGMRLTSVADQAGYASTQAFGRAFERQFGATPARWLRAQAQLPAREEPALQLVHWPEAQPCHGLRYEGDATDVSRFFDEVVTRLQRSGTPRRQWQVFGRGDDAAAAPALRRPGARVVLDAVVLAAPLAHAPIGFAAGSIAGGAYARLSLGAAGYSLDAALHEAGWQRTEGAVLRHYDTDPAHTPPPERREWLYVPVARR